MSWKKPESTAAKIAKAIFGSKTNGKPSTATLGTNGSKWASPQSKIKQEHRNNRARAAKDAANQWNRGKHW